MPRLLPFALALAALLPRPATAFNLSGDRWTTTPVRMELQLGSTSGTLIDGSASWNVVANDALSAWNTNLVSFRFSGVLDSTAGQSRSNRINNVLFSPTVYGDTWDDRTLAITLLRIIGTSLIESDVLFNSNLSWNSYRGATRTSAGATVYDFRRVALHEFGHALGLDHPDDAGQFVSAIMNSMIGNLDSLTADDIAGARAIYDPGLTAPAIATQPASRTVALGQSVTFTVVATGTAPLAYRWSRNGVAIAGATSPSFTIGSVAASDAGSYTVSVTNSAGTATSTTAVLTVTTASGPFITTQPASQTVTAGSAVSFTVVASGTAPLTYVWRKNGAPVAGATSATYAIVTAATGDAGSYTVIVTNSAGSITSTAATLTVNPAGPASRLSNLSVLTTLARNQILTVGFTMTGGTKQVLLRAVGPGLATLSVPGTMPDPQLTLFANSVKIDANDDWLGANAGIMNSVGAFPLRAGSLDAALVRSITGGNTVEVTGSALAFNPNTNSGTVIVELYDTGSANAPRLTNISALNLVSSTNLLTAGFTLAGSGKKRLLVRAVGPGLTPLGVGGALADPKLAIFNSAQVKIGENDTWDRALTSTFTSVGAFGLPADSRDAAIVVELDASPSGTGYTVQVSGVGGTTGLALVELYELP